MWWLFSVLLSFASADVPLPSYKAAVARRAWFEVNEILEIANHLASEELDQAMPGEPVQLSSKVSDKYLEALRVAEAFEKQVIQTSGLAFLQGLTWRQMGNLENAEKHYRRSIQLDDTAADAWYDLGEILLIQNRLAEARTCFEHVAVLITTGPNAWRGPIRIAEVAGNQRDVAGFEANIREALRRGFSLHQIRGQANWKRFYQDEVLSDSVQKLVRVYGDPTILESLAP